jgi:hypothetical protein
MLLRFTGSIAIAISRGTPTASQVAAVLTGRLSQVSLPSVGEDRRRGGSSGAGKHDVQLMAD